MSIREARIWVLITDGVTARICSTGDGTATSILAPRLSSSAFDCDKEADRHGQLYRAWFKSGSQAALGSAKRQFTSHLAQILHEGISDRAFDGLIIIATPQILPGLQRALSPATRAALVGEIVRDLPNFDAVEKEFGVELHH